MVKKLVSPAIFVLLFLSGLSEAQESEQPAVATPSSTAGVANDSHQSFVESAGVSSLSGAPADNFGKFITEQLDEQVRVDQLIGLTVLDNQGVKLGVISDLIIDTDYSIKGAVLSIGGILGIGSKTIAIAWENIDITVAANRLIATVDLTQEEISNAPNFLTLSEVRVKEQVRLAQQERDRQQRLLLNQLKSETQSSNKPQS